MTKKIILLIILVCCFGIANAQQYHKVKVTKKDGAVVEGKKGNITEESFSFITGGMQQTYPLSDINLIQAKEGKAGKYALYFGGGCLGVCIISGLAVGSDGIEDAGGTTGTYVAGCILWTGIFAGIGALIGRGADDWQNVYSGGTSYWNRFNLNFGSNQAVNYNTQVSKYNNQVAKYNFSLSYKF